MQPKPRRVDLSPDNFIAGIAGQLNAPELGIYWLCCLLIYSHGGPTVCDEKRLGALLPGTHWRTIRAALKHLHDIGKLGSEHGQTMAKGCSGPLDDAVRRIARARENGSKGGRPYSNSNGLHKPTTLRDEKLPAPSLPPSPSPSPPISTPSLRSGDTATPKRKPRCSLPESFPDDASKAWAETKWLERGRADLCGRMAEIAESFRDHHRGHDTRSADWAGSWRTWTKNELNFSRNHKNGNGKSPSAHDKFLAGGAAFLAGFDAKFEPPESDDHHDEAGGFGPRLLPS